MRSSDQWIGDHIITRISLLKRARILLLTVPYSALLYSTPASQKYWPSTGSSIGIPAGTGTGIHDYHDYHDYHVLQPVPHSHFVLFPLS